MVSALVRDSPIKFNVRSDIYFAEFSSLTIRVLLDLLQCSVEVSPAALVLGAELVPQANREWTQVRHSKLKCLNNPDMILYFSSYSYNTNQRPSSYRHIQGGRTSGYSNQGFGSQYSTFSSQGQRVPQQQQQQLPMKTQPRFRQRPPVRDKMRQCILILLA